MYVGPEASLREARCRNLFPGGSGGGPWHITAIFAYPAEITSEVNYLLRKRDFGYLEYFLMEIGILNAARKNQDLVGEGRSRCARIRLR